MRDQFIVGNWKMHGSKASVAQLLKAFKLSNFVIHASVKMVICPPYIFLDQTQTLLQHSQLEWAAQNMAAEAEKEGPYTGEISASMLREFGCRYVLLGHSERRILYAETDDQIAKKFKLATELGLKPILCIGETGEQRKAHQTQSVLKKQLEKVVKLGPHVFKQGIVAYEPVWAIGTGLSATTGQAQEAHQFLRDYLRESLGSDLAQNLPILYGGSVKVGNAKALFEISDIDGALIGGASLNANDFLDIYKALANRS